MLIVILRRELIGMSRFAAFVVEQARCYIDMESFRLVVLAQLVLDVFDDDDPMLPATLSNVP